MFRARNGTLSDFIRLLAEAQMSSGTRTPKGKAPAADKPGTSLSAGEIPGDRGGGRIKGHVASGSHGYRARACFIQPVISDNLQSEKWLWFGFALL